MPGIRQFLCVLALTASAVAVSPPASEPAAPVPSAQKLPNIILITMDTTRADRMGFLGSDRGLTPGLDRLAQDSLVFTHAYSQAPYTPTSHATILTGTYPPYHQVLTFPTPLGKTLPDLPEILRLQGYRTAAFVGSTALDPRVGGPGFERGFESYDANFKLRTDPKQSRYETEERRAAEVVQHALAWLSERPPGPFFLWVHVFDPHAPYDPPEPYKTRYAKTPYDGEIAYMDSALGTFFKELKAHDLYDNTIIAATADHGESLGAHGEDQHALFLYDETIHVPLLIKLPHGQAAGNRVDDTVELADIMPTVLESIGIAIPREVQGESMVPLIEPGKKGKAAWQDRGAYSEADYGHLSFGWSALQSLRIGKYLYVQAPRRELYEREADPSAEHNLAAASSAVADTLAAKIRNIQREMASTGQAPISDLDQARVERLAALGYFARVNNPNTATSPEQGVDPKDKIGTINALVRVSDLLGDNDCEHAVPVLKKAVVDDPYISLLHYLLGQCLMDQKSYSDAVPELRKALELDPHFAAANLNLGKALMEVHDFEGAETPLQQAAPTFLTARVFLVVVYAKLNRVPEEIAACRKVLEFLPDHYGATFNLGRFLSQSGDLAGAVSNLQKAAALRPTAPGPHFALSKAYTKLGREVDANRELAEAERLESQAAMAPAEPGPETEKQ